MAFKAIIQRELKRMVSRRIYLFLTVVAPVASFLFFAAMFRTGVPTNLPVAVVDRDHTSISRSLIRSLDAFEETDVAMEPGSFAEAREAMQRGEIYGIFYIPPEFRRSASSEKEPLLSFYTNDSYILPGSLIYKDMKLQSALANGVVQRTRMTARGVTEPQLSARLNPVALDTHPLNNPWLSYAVYLSNILMPAVLSMFVMFLVVFSVTEELKRGSATEWMELSGGSIGKALAGKLLPQTVLMGITGTFCLALMYRFLHFPLNSGFFPMFTAMLLLIVASQGFALLVLGIFKNTRIALSACALWAVLSFSISGFTFPVRSMPEAMQWFAHLFPMRYYFLLYVDQALNGIPVAYSISSYLALLLFAGSPLAVLPRIRSLLRANKYTP